MGRMTNSELQVYWMQVALTLQLEHGLCTQDKRPLDWRTLEALMKRWGLTAGNVASTDRMAEAVLRSFTPMQF